MVTLLDKEMEMESRYRPAGGAAIEKKGARLFGPLAGGGGRG
jgi:hypothetical protein